MKKAFLVSILLIYNLLNAQNLVINPSFEDYKLCPDKLSAFKSHIKYWTTPSKGSSDYFHICSSKDVKTPKNIMGFQMPFEGKAYAGIYTYVEHNKYHKTEAYREYIKGQVIDTLIANHWYRASFYISLSDKSRYATKDFGVLFSNQDFFFNKQSEIKVSDLRKETLNFMYHYIYIESRSFYTNKNEWIKISIEFKAKGHEKYFVIGNFKDDKNTEILKIGKLFKRKSAYYYIDLISIESLAVESYSTKSRIHKP